MQLTRLGIEPLAPNDALAIDLIAAIGTEDFAGCIATPPQLLDSSTRNGRRCARERDCLVRRFFGIECAQAVS